MLAGIDLKSWLGLATVGALVTTIGSILGAIIKDLILARLFENWKQEKTLKQIYQKFSDPLQLSIHELSSRICEIHNHYPTIYLTTNVLESHPERQTLNSIEDPYFQRYKLVSTAYRFCAFLGWLELYRQEITYLNSGKNSHTKKIESIVNKIRSDFADGQLNQSPDWSTWKDNVVFREELRAIGESMIEQRGTTRSVIGYGRYCEYLDSDESNSIQHWSSVIINFFIDLRTDNLDFRRNRLEHLFIHLIDFARQLDSSTIQPYLDDKYRELKLKMDL
jgi:hypothetical protein